MSYDRQIDQLCTHLVVEELLPVAFDGVTVVPIRPISSSNSVVVRLNGEMTVPSSGVHVPASSGGTKEGPFNIKEGVNNLLVVQVDNDPPQSVSLPTASKVPTKRLADILSASLQGIKFYDERNVLKFKSDHLGRDATIFISPASTLATLVGIKTNRIYRGKQAAPGWTLINDPNTLNDRPTRLIVFDEPTKGLNDFVEVNYTTVRQECRRCGGIGVENDWRFGNDGNVIEVRQEALLIQELLKVTYTVRGSNPFHPWYGTTIIEQIGQKLSARGVVQNAIVSDINVTFTRWQSIKRQQEQNSGQFVSDEEFPFRLDGVVLEQSQDDPTVMFVTINVQSRSLKPIQLTRGIRLPQPLDLLGSTQAQGVFRQTLRDFSLVS